MQDMRFITTEERKATCRRENEVLIQRLKHDGVTVPYRVVENPLKFGDDEWSRVVAVFVQVVFLMVVAFDFVDRFKYGVLFCSFQFLFYSFGLFIYIVEVKSCRIFWL